MLATGSVVASYPEINALKSRTSPPASAWKSLMVSVPVALAAIPGDAVATELPARFSVHANRIYAWKKTVLSDLAGLFDKDAGGLSDKEAELSRVYGQLGRVTLERGFLSRKSGL